MASRIGVYICHCGINIAATVDSQAVANYAATLPHVVVARDYMYMCSDPGQEMIKQDIRDYDLTGVVVASCSPRMHEVTFRAVVQEEGVNPYQFEMANIREQCSWVHADREIATQKTKELVAGVVAKAVLLEPLEEREVDVTPRALVIGGGIAGLEAALDIADAGYKVYLVEKQPSLGGRMAQLNVTPRMENAGELVAGRKTGRDGQCRSSGDRAQHRRQRPVDAAPGSGSTPGATETGARRRRGLDLALHERALGVQPGQPQPAHPRRGDPLAARRDRPGPGPRRHDHPRARLRPDRVA